MLSHSVLEDLAKDNGSQMLVVVGSVLARNVSKDIARYNAIDLSEEVSPGHVARESMRLPSA